MIKKTYKSFKNKSFINNIEMNSLKLSQFQRLTFDEMTNKMKNEDFVATSRNELMKFLKQVGYSKDFSMKIVLSSFLIFFHKEELLSKDQYAEKLFELAKNLVLAIERENHKEVMISLETFVSFFGIWKKRDSMLLVRPMITTYMQIDIALGDEKNEKRIEEYENMKKSIRNKVRCIGGKQGLEYLDNGKIPYYLDEKVFQDMESTIKRAFWDVFQENMEGKKYDALLQIIKDLKDLVFSLIPNRKDLLKDFESKLDLDLLEQLLKVTQDLDYNYILNITNLFIFYVEKLQSASEDENTKMFKDNLLLKIQNKEEFPKLLRFFFENCFQKLELIKTQMSILGMKK